MINYIISKYKARLHKCSATSQKIITQMFFIDEYFNNHSMIYYNNLLIDSTDIKLSIIFIPVL